MDGRDVAKDIVEKAYERREESRQRLQDGSGATAGPTNFRAEDRPSARPLRREE
jgi:hypothetical protein